MLKKVDHIGIAVSDLEDSTRRYEKITGKESAQEEVVEEQKVETTFFPVGEVRLELLQGTSPDSPISKFIEKRGEGIHHICFEVEDLEEAKESLSRQGLQFIEQASGTGAGGSKVAFIHPKSTGGILMELVEYPKSSKT
ncbi:methylmalonyl-CoA epimerase [candidate division KSB1 bacterium]|nr:methylmalonyl-CoA epimerase [candidate division KSB1 bacterium]NIR72559.1 methylmalonyl-CoA epimerase [candidate division KSB1 bacterium]NIS27311.1 methylmalonyl-CoA epimerase [candidate division KSB1 bacterium]NIT73521.1 methylmalonyl-CoA epimerase [candidate division KSB1 bacterium]NIU28041.1 methylmalonyl-CoA epimerase [candidate division KSB1 bacterium]